MRLAPDQKTRLKNIQNGSNNAVLLRNVPCGSLGDNKKNFLLNF